MKVSGTKGRPDSFEVSLNEELIHSKLETGEFPDTAQMVEMVKKTASGGTVEKKKSKLFNHENKCVHH